MINVRSWVWRWTRSVEADQTRQGSSPCPSSHAATSFTDVVADWNNVSNTDSQPTPFCRKAPALQNIWFLRDRISNRRFLLFSGCCWSRNVGKCNPMKSNEIPKYFRDYRTCQKTKLRTTAFKKWRDLLVDINCWQKFTLFLIAAIALQSVLISSIRAWVRIYRPETMKNRILIAFCRQ